MITLEEVKSSVKVIRDVWKEKSSDPGLALLHCVSSYPTPSEKANLKAVETLSKDFPFCVPGYSDHTLGISAALNSVSLGARVVEKHFTIDKNFSDFRDHKLSADPKELKELVNNIRNLEKMLGDGEIIPQSNELSMMSNLRRSAAASRKLKAGTLLLEEDFIWIRPGTGITQDNYKKFLGKVLKKDKEYSELIHKSDF